MIDDINADKLELWKYVDDTTIAEAVPIDGNSKIQESVDDFVDFLGMNISSDLKWNIHITEIMKKCTPRFHFVRQLKRAHLATSELLTFYLCCIRPVAEYGCQLFHNALPK